MKGIATFWVQVFFGLMVIIFSVVLYYFGIGRMLSIQVTVQGSELDRRAIDFAQVLLSEESLVYSDGGVLYRGIFDESKLTGNIDSLDKKIGYPDESVTATIEDLENGKKWVESFGTSAGAISSGVSPKRSFPVAIRYSSKEIHTGMLSVILVD